MAKRKHRRQAKVRDGLVVEIEGIDELLRNLRKLGDDISRELEEAVQAGAAVTMRKIAGNVGGSIRDSLTTETTLSKPKQVVIDVGPNKDAWYARFVEYGTAAHHVGVKDGEALKIYGSEIAYRYTVNPSGAPASPFMRPGFDASIGPAGNAIRIRLANILKAVGT